MCFIMCFLFFSSLECTKEPTITICNGVVAMLLSDVYTVHSFLVLSNFIFPFLFQAGKTLSVRKWQAAFNPDGCLDIASVLSRIQKGVRFLEFVDFLQFPNMLIVLELFPI